MRKREIEAIKKEVKILEDLNHPKREMVLKRWDRDMEKINKLTGERIESIRKEKIKNARNRKANIF